MYAFTFAFFLGSIAGIALFSELIKKVFFRKINKPKQDIFSVLSAYILGCILAGYTFADGTEPIFVRAFLFYAPATIIVLIVQLLRFKYNNKQ